MSLSHSTCFRPASTTTLQNLPVCSDCQYVASPGLIGWDPGLMGTKSSGGAVPLPSVAAQVMKLVSVSVRQVPGLARL